MEVLERLDNESAKSYAYRNLRENIINLKLAPGETISDVEIAEKLSVSRTPVREAINKLKEESDIIEIFPQRGMRVSLIDTDTVNEAKFLRMTIEMKIIEIVCENIKEEELNNLKENIQLQKFYLEQKNANKIMLLDNSLHKYLFKISGKEKIYKLIQGLQIHYDRVRNLENVGTHLNKIVEDHIKLIEYIDKKDVEDAKEILNKHLDRLNENEEILRKKFPKYFTR